MRSAGLDVCFVGSDPSVRATGVDEERICLKCQKFRKSEGEQVGLHFVGGLPIPTLAV